VQSLLRSDRAVAKSWNIIADMAPHCASLDAGCACLSVPAIIAVEQHRAGSAPSRNRAIFCGRFRPHSKERFVRHPEDLAIQRLFAFRPMRPTARFDRPPTLRFGVIAAAARSRTAKTRMNTRISPAHDGRMKPELQ
jgi:hypothetical protein